MLERELRIGNLVQVMNCPIEVKSIPMSGEYKEGDLTMLYEPINVEPIPLTEEWLIKFGFNKCFSSFSIGKFIIDPDHDNW